MQITPIRTPKITPDNQDILDIIDQAVSTVEDGSVVAVTSKIISICERRVLPLDAIDKDTLIAQEAERYLPGNFGNYNYHFAVKHHTLAGSAGVDQSNGAGHYILWPRDPQATADMIWRHLRTKHSIKHLGVVITDSASQPMRRGAIGIALAHSGFSALKRYAGQPDLFGRPFAVEHANISGGLAAAAVLAMGEGTEQTPLCVIRDPVNVEFQDRVPSPEELESLHLTLETDVFAPFFAAAPWQTTDHEA